ncbi:MAG: hypothetical protein IPH11_12500 [Ignavibacteriales bacterium]|nr:hypothetical protein [Ignavibacteriales bacterium]
MLYVSHLDVDRPLYNDHNKMKALVKSCEILEAVEKKLKFRINLILIKS